MATFQKFIQSIQADGNDGKAFEIFCRWFLKNDPYWKTQVDEVWLWDDWPDRWGPDCGLDLVFQDKKGDVWAVIPLVRFGGKSNLKRRRSRNVQHNSRTT